MSPNKYDRRDLVIGLVRQSDLVRLSERMYRRSGVAATAVALMCAAA